MDSNAFDQRPTRSGVIALKTLLLALLLLTVGSAASAQFPCPTLPPGDGGAGLGMPASTVEIAVIGGDGYLGGFAPIRVTVTDGEDAVSTVLADICFDGTKLDIAQMEVSTEAPCEDDEDCPGGQVCGDDNTCLAFVVTACTLDERLSGTHRFIATAPVIPENPDNPRRLRLVVLSQIPEPQDCTNDKDCDAGEICSEFGGCLVECASDDDCPPSTRCMELEGDMVCSPLTVISDGDLVSCNFDVFENAVTGETPLTFGFLQVGDDGIPVPMALPAVGIPGSIDIQQCQDDEDCPPGEICDIETGICMPATPTPTLTITPTGGGGTPTPTGPTATRTPTGTPTGPTRTFTPTVTPTGPTRTFTPTVTPTGPTRTPTGPTPTSTSSGARFDDDSCLIISQSRESRAMRSWLLLAAPALIIFMRRRRRH